MPDARPDITILKDRFFEKPAKKKKGIFIEKKSALFPAMNEYRILISHKAVI